MSYKYRYLGMKGIFIGDKHVHSGEIIETDKPISEFGFSIEDFKDMSTWDELTKILAEAESIDSEKLRLETEQKNKIDALNAEYNLKLKALNDRLKSLKIIYKENFEPRLPKEDKKRYGILGGK